MEQIISMQPYGKSAENSQHDEDTDLHCAEGACSARVRTQISGTMVVADQKNKCKQRSKQLLKMVEYFQIHWCITV